MNTAEKLAFLRIARTRGVGPATYAKLAARYGSPIEIVKAWNAAKDAKYALISADKVENELRHVERAGGVILAKSDADYPASLVPLPDAPLVLTVLGDVKALKTRQIALVGNRNASAQALTWTRDLATQLARAGVAVTSGLARGIDTAAHEGALAAGGITIAVVAGGVDHVYPPENAALRERIIAHGAVVSEQPWGMAPQASFFPRRNRIIAGLSVGVVVGEATRHSGSLITAECALEYGRDVYAVPGSPGEPRSGGPNWLLKNGAFLVENAEDILGQLPHTPAPYVAPARRVEAAFPSLFDGVVDGGEEEPELAEDGRGVVFALLGSVGVDADSLARLSALPGDEVASILVELELDGLAVRDALGLWRKG